MSADLKRGIRYGVVVCGLASALVHHSVVWWAVWSAWAIMECYIVPPRSPVVIIRDCDVSHDGKNFYVSGVADICIEHCRVVSRATLSEPTGPTTEDAP